MDAGEPADGAVITQAVVARPSSQTLSVLIVSNVATRHGGAATDMRQTAEGLLRMGHRVAIAASFREAARSIRRQSVDVVHVFGCLPSPTPFLTMLLARASAARLVWTPVFHPSRRDSWAGYGLLRAMKAFDAVAPRAAILADAVIGMTEAEAAYFRRIGAKRIECIPPGVAPRVPVDQTRLAGFRDRMGLVPGSTVLIVARGDSRKGLPFGLRSFQELRRSRPDTQLLLVGPDSAKWSGHEGVHPSGWLKHADMDLAYSTADVVFIPSLYESFSRIVIEAWAWELPVVATDRVGLAPVIGEGGGAVVPYGNARVASAALADFLANPDSASACGSRGRTMADGRFSLEDVEKRIGELYGSLVGSEGL